jgi:hypothetical protein
MLNERQTPAISIKIILILLNSLKTLVLDVYFDFMQNSQELNKFEQNDPYCMSPIPRLFVKQQFLNFLWASLFLLLVSDAIVNVLQFQCVNVFKMS